MDVDQRATEKINKTNKEKFSKFALIHYCPL